MKEIPKNEKVVAKMEKDVDRLILVSDRFGKIGRSPQLEVTNITEEKERMKKYMRSRALVRLK